MNQNEIFQKGHRVNRDIINKRGTLLIPKNKVLSDKLIDLLKKHDIIISEDEKYNNTSNTSVSTTLDMNKPTNNIENHPMNNESPTDQSNVRSLDIIKEMVEQVTEQTKDIFQFAKNYERIPIDDVEKNMVPAISEMVENEYLYTVFSTMVSKEKYTYQHSIAVGILATLIGKWLNFNEKDLSELTIAATLHDIGKMKVPAYILNKEEPLTTNEYELIKKHTVHGYHWIKNTPGLSHRVALVSLQHHEREDGSGYPFGLKRLKIDLFSKIIAVADIFHAMTSNRIYKEPKPFYMVMKEMQEDTFGRLDPQITTMFISRMMDLMVGNTVELTDGRPGKIVLINPNDPTRPLVQTQSEFIDLSQNRSVHLKNVMALA